MSTAFNDRLSAPSECSQLLPKIRPRILDFVSRNFHLFQPKQVYAEHQKMKVLRFIHVYEVRREDKRGIDLISDALRLWADSFRSRDPFKS